MTETGQQKSEHDQTVRIGGVDVVYNAVQETKNFRVALDVTLQEIKGEGLTPELKAIHRTSRERSLAITKIQEAIMWLGMDLKAQNTPNPYPDSYDPTNDKIAPTADGLQM